MLFIFLSSHKVQFKIYEYLIRLKRFNNICAQALKQAIK